MTSNRRRRRPVAREPSRSTWWAPFAALLVAGGVVVTVALYLRSAPPPAVLPDGMTLESTERAPDPFSLANLHDRVSPGGLARIGAYVDYFQHDRRRGLEGGLARSTRYLARFKRIFRSLGLPEALAYLPLIESGYVENAVSPAKAVGIWQFTEETGRRFNLITNHWTDPRRDPMSSARAAALYLRQLHRRFDNWELALAAYNSGSGTVRWAMRTNRKADKPTDYWSLDGLPDETRNYVPAFIAAVLIANHLEAYGFEEIQFMPKLVFDRIKVTPRISLAFLAKHLGISEQSLFELNPELIRRETPPGDSFYLLRTPPGTRNLVRAKLAPDEKPPKDWVLHRVVASDTVQELASRFQAQPASIRKINRIQDNTELAQRTLVLIPL